jgi:hypothetical protein
MWEILLQTVCFRLKIDAESSGGHIILFCSKPLKTEDKVGIRSIIPENIPVSFIEGVKKATLDALRSILSCDLKDIQSKHLGIETDDDDFDAHAIHQLLINDGWYDTWSINGVSYSKAIIMATRKTPKRDVPITDNELMDLKICLETSVDVNDFINQL